MKKRSIGAIRARVKKELEAEKTSSQTLSTSSSMAESRPEPSGHTDRMAVCGVFYRCPSISEEILPKSEWEQRIRNFLKEQMQTDPMLAAVLTLYSLNGSQERVQHCVETLIKIFENILQNPSEEKYRRIRKTNKIFQEKVIPLDGATLIIENAGFDSEDEFYVYPQCGVSDEGLQRLEMVVDALKCAEPITLELDRNLQVLLPSQASARKNLPKDFYHLQPEDLKKAQQARIDAIEKSSMLMTKAMREKEELRELRNYKYCLIRIRFPDGIYLQGTFGSYEPFKAVADFVKENVTDESGRFQLIGPFGEKISNNEEKTLLELKLVPSSVMKFQSDADAQLLPEVLILVQNMEVS